MHRITRLTVLTGAALFVLSALAYGQETAISGAARDNTGAVLPGVTVEASSPSLIEKTRRAVTDGAGQYKIINLTPGLYAVSFSLQGFKTFKRDNIELVDGFVAPVSASMEIGNVSEEVTVQASSPIVDVQSLHQSTVMTRDTMDAVPTGKNIQAVGILIPGTTLQVGGGSALSRDVGGSGNMQQSPLTYHGSTNSVTAVDGLRMNDFEVSGQYADLFNDGSFQEVSYSTGADSAEYGQAGLRVNMVPKDGGNTFHGSVPGNWTGKAFQWDNFGQDLKDRGLTNVSQIQKIYDFNPSAGGPILKDRLWFQGTFRRQRVDKTVVDSYYNLLGPTSVKYVADLSRPAIDDGWAMNGSGRLTLQINRKSKVTGYYDRSNRERPHWGASATNPPEASGVQTLPMEFTESWKFQSTLTNRLLLDLGFGEYHQDYSELYQPTVTPTTYRITDQTSGKTSGAYTAQVIHLQHLFDYNAKMSYVTGSHNISLGAQFGRGPHETITTRIGNLSMRFGPTATNSASTVAGYGPNQVTLQLPVDQIEHMDMDAGFFVNDKWRFHRATVTAGLRFDWFIGSVGAESVLPNPWLTTVANGVKTFEPVSDVPNWKDLSPRVGVAYDVFGNGKTAARVSLSRFVDPQTVSFAANQGPIGLLTTSQSLTWTDTNGDYTIYNPDGSIQSNELAPIPASSTFGTLVPGTRSDPAIGNGWQHRPYSWEFDAGVQQQLWPRVSAGLTYWRRLLGGNQTNTFDLAHPPSMYQGPYCLVGPSDPRLPGGGGQKYCGIYEQTPAYYATASNNYTTFLKNYLDPLGISPINYQHGLDLQMTARAANGARIQGGVSFARRVQDTCYTTQLGNPQLIINPVTGIPSCSKDNATPFQPDIKLLGTYPLPWWGIQAAATYQHTPGPQQTATYAFTQGYANLNGFAIATAPGSSAGQIAGATQSFDLMGGTQVYGKPLNQLDVRTSKRIKIGKDRLEIQADLYNVFNSDWVFTQNNTFGTSGAIVAGTAAATYTRPTNVLTNRMFKIGGQFDF